MSSDGHDTLPRATEPATAWGTLRRTWHLVLGISVWAVHLAVTYVGVRLACVHGDGEWGPVSSQVVVVAVATLAAGAALVWLVVRSWRSVRAARAHDVSPEERDAAGFVARTSLMVNVVMLYAVVLEGVGLFFLSGCGA